jgi:hypothetical protein
MLIGCRWYFLDEIRIELFTKNNTLLPIKDPILLPEFDYPNVLSLFPISSLNLFQILFSLPVGQIQIYGPRKGGKERPMASGSGNGCEENDGS